MMKRHALRIAVPALSMLLSFAVPAFSETSDIDIDASPSTGRNAAGRRIPLIHWLYRPGDGPGWEQAEFAGSGWEPVDLPAALKVEDNYLWLRASVSSRPLRDGRSLYLMLGRLDAACQVYVNGALIGERGTGFGGASVGFSVPANYPGAFLLPDGVWRTGAPNDIALRLHLPASGITPPVFEIGDLDAVRWDERVLVFFNFSLYAILGALCAFIGAYFLSLWISRPAEKTNLWYALSSWAIAFYFSEMGSAFPLLPYGFNRAIAKSCLTVSMAFLVLFFIDHFKMRRPRPVSILIVLVPVAMTAAYLLVRDDNAGIARVFNLGLIFIQASIVFIVYASLRAVFGGDRMAIPLLVGVALGVGLGTHDVIYSLLGKRPFAWLQGIGFFCVNLSLFVTLTLRSSKLHRDLENYSRVVEEKTEQLSSYIGRIAETADSVSALSAEIDRDANTAASAADALAAAAARIESGADTQTRAVGDSEEAMIRLGVSLALVRQGVDSQAAGIEDSAESVAIVADAAAKVSQNIQSTARFAQGLEGTAEEGRRASKALDEAIRKIQDTSAEIVSIVAAVEDFAERTNLLAMNAAIEAAHAGASGRGFAVIAGEIKNLAAASSERSARIRDSIKEITGRIGNGVDANQKVMAALDSVAGNAKIALDSIVSVGDSLEVQRSATDQLRLGLHGLSDSAASIRKEAEQQETEGNRIRSRMAELVAVSRELRSAIAGIAQENASIAQSVRGLAVVSRSGKDAVASMRRLLEARASER